MRYASASRDSGSHQISIVALIVTLLYLLAGFALASPAKRPGSIFERSVGNNLQRAWPRANGKAPAAPLSKDVPNPTKQSPKLPPANQNFKTDPKADSKGRTKPADTKPTTNTKPPTDWKKCAKKYNGPWESATSKGPTYLTIKEDMKRCGNVGTGAPTVFYSFGAATSQMRPFKDSLKPIGTMFNDALPEEWTVAVNKAFPEATKPEVQDYIVNFYAQALAVLSKGEVFFGMSQEVFAKRKGCYSDPRPSRNDPAKPEANRWLEYEFPALQRNDAVTKVTIVVPDSQPPYQLHPGWHKGDGQRILPAPGTVLPPIIPLPDINFPPVNPPSPPTCKPRATGHYQDSHETAVRSATRAYCHRFGDRIVHAKEEHDSEEFKPRGAPPFNDRRDDIYDFKLNSVAHCDAKDGYNLKEPVKGFKCEDILFSAWSNCNNGGRGGSITAGCLTYEIAPKY